ncbi:cupin domain-containing protein [Azospirillum halopraeferens]|uniref:cupin domain-containing protein n=1 Tax=Azospirillum halopraeferens TaxID=34010 RepID=UPI0003FB74A0|nr:cupin domain-containing protein [Azospirillum halopraeferens]
MDPDRIIALLGMQPHPEGGHFVETYRHAGTVADGGRGVMTGIYFLLRAGERSHWHTVDAVEMWHWYGGGPLELAIADHDGATVRTLRLGMDLAAGERPQAVVPEGAWQAARPLGAWTLVGCTVAPAFRFEGFRLAPEGWEPGRPL